MRGKTALPNTSGACARAQMEALVLNGMHRESQRSGFLNEMSCQGGGQDISLSVHPFWPQGMSRGGKAEVERVGGVGMHGLKHGSGARAGATGEF